MISSLSVIADLAAHHGKQLGNEMPASFTVNAKRPAVRARATGSLLLRAQGNRGALPDPRVGSRIAPLEQGAWEGRQPMTRFLASDDGSATLLMSHTRPALEAALASAVKPQVTIDRKSVV